MTLLDITRLSHDGRGIGHDNSGKTVFVDGVLPGERISYTIQKQKRRYIDAQVVEIITAGPDRVAAKCAHFLTCGGCAQQHIGHEAQLKHKQQAVLDQLLHFGSVVPAQIMEPLAGPIWGYRTKARLGVRYVIKKDKVLVGFRERQKSYIAEIDGCEVLHPSIAQLIVPLKEFIRNLQGFQTIAQIEVAVGDEQPALIFRHLEPLSVSDLQQLIEFAQQKYFQLYLQSAGPESVIKVWPADNVQRLYYSLPDYNLRFAFHPTDFTQVNPAINCKMVAQAIAWMHLTPQDRVLDLFCGIGNFTLAIAKYVAHVTGVEGSETAVQRAYENASGNNITNVDFYAADLTKSQIAEIWLQHSYTKVLLDPPRSGALEILPLVAKLAPQLILYVSCNPATLARDSGILTKEYGYKMQRLSIIDMFPHTMHVETMTVFIK